MVRVRRSDGRDDGGVLVITLILTVVLAVVVVALASYVTAALRTSDVASERTESRADASAVLNWAIEEFAKKQLTPEDDCGEAPSFATIGGVPAELSGNGSTTTLECRQTTPVNSNAAVHLRAVSTGEQIRTVEATVLVPLYSHGAQVADWRVDIPIQVPDYSATTTTVPGPTTSVAPPNQEPTATDTTWTLLASDTSSQSVIASDPDGSVASVVFDAPLPTNVTLSAPTGPTSFDVTTDATTGTFTVPFRVLDDLGLSSAQATLTIVVDTTTPSTTEPPPTTTTLAPNLNCTFTITSAAADQKSGIAQLRITNSGGETIGWEATIGWPRQWDASWPAALGVTTVNIPPNSQEKVVVGGDTIGESEEIDYSIALTWRGGDPKIVLNAVRPCAASLP